jgi:hypothetical protein
MVVEHDGSDVQHIAQGCSVFTTKSIGPKSHDDDKRPGVSRLLEQAAAAASSTARLTAALNDAAD